MPGLPAEGALVGLLVALGGGLLIGIERERRKGEGPGRASAGVRSFTLAALAGAIAQALAQPWLVALGGALLLALIAIGYARDRSGDPGVTTEIALFVTYLLGVAAIERPAGAAAGAVLVAALLAARSRLHRFAKEMLTAAELHDALLLAGAALVLLPLLPDEQIGWLGGLNPHRIWSLAVLIMLLQGAGHVARRWLGAHRGLLLAGLAGGFASSTATVAALGARARRERAQLDACAAAALASTMATFLQFALIAGAVHPPALALLAIPLAAGFAATAVVTGALYLRARRVGESDAPAGRAFSLAHAAGFALVLAAVGAALGFIERLHGTHAVQGAAALAGFADAHAAGAAALALAADSRIADAVAVWACLLGLSTNTASKLVLAFIAGGRGYGARLAAGLLAGLAAAWAGVLAWP